MKRSLLTYGLLLLILRLNSQDIHFSQAVNLPLWQSPAAAGMMASDYRISAVYKNQWASVPVPFNTLLISGDANIIKLKNHDRINAGLVLYSDRAGDSKLTTYQADLAVSYAKSLGDSLHFLSAGFMFGTAGRSFNMSKLNFDNQFIDGAFNGSIPIDEIFNVTSYSTIDIGAGIMYSNFIKSKAKIDLGFGVYHLNTPTISFYGDGNVKLNHRYHAFATAEILINPTWQMKPLFVFQQQDVKQEFLFGNIMTYRINSFNIPYLATQFGIMYRNQDALVAYAGMKYNDLLIGLSYDINTSQLSNATNGNGGVELSLVYQMSKVEKISSKGAVCPLF